MGLCFQKSCVRTVSKCLWDIIINVVVVSVERLEKGLPTVAVLAVLSRYLISEKTASTITTFQGEYNIFTMSPYCLYLNSMAGNRYPVEKCYMLPANLKVFLYLL